MSQDIHAVIRDILAIPPASATAADRARFALVREALRAGTIRAARRVEGRWRADQSVKEAILWAFRAGAMTSWPAETESPFFRYTDKDTLPMRRIEPGDNIRFVPGGSSVRDGSYIAPGVIIMPPSFVNIGAYVDAGTLIDSHVLVGSCAQVGKRVHLSAGVQIGGVLEPVNAVPVVIEDDVMVGGNCGIYEGTIVGEKAVIGTGVILNGSTPVYDLVNEVIYRRTAEHPLEIPPRAVVVQGSKPAKGTFAEQHKIHMYAPVIVKYRDDKTDAATALEESLR